MTSKKLSELQGTGQVASNDLFLVTNGADSKKITRQDLFQLIFNTTMNKISDLPTMDEADASSDLTGNSILVVNNGVEKIIPISELKKVVEEAAAAIEYDDTVTNFSVDNVQDAIEALFTLVTVNPGTVFITDIVPTSTGSVTNKVYSSGSLISFDTDTSDITVSILASVANPLMTPTVNVNGVAVSNFVAAGGGNWTGTVDITLPGSVDVVAVNSAGSVSTATATLLSQPTPTILAAYFAGSDGTSLPFTDVYVSATAYWESNPRNFATASWPITGGSITGFAQNYKPLLPGSVTEIAHLIPSSHLFLIVETDSPIDKIEIISDATDKVIPAGVYSAVNISGNTYRLAPTLDPTPGNPSPSAWTTQNFTASPTSRGVILRTRGSISGNYGPTFNSRTDIPVNPVPANCYASVLTNSAIPSVSVNYLTAIAYPATQFAIKGIEIAVVTPTYTNLSSSNNDYLMFRFDRPGGNTLALNGGETTGITPTKTFVGTSVGDYIYATNTAANPPAYMLAVKRSNGQTSSPIRLPINVVNAAAKYTIQMYSVGVPNTQIGTALAGNKLRSGGNLGTYNQDYWAILSSDQVMVAGTSTTLPVIADLGVNAGQWVDPEFSTYSIAGDGSGQSFKRKLTIADNDIHTVHTFVRNNTPGLSGIQGNFDPGSSLGDKYNIKGFVPRVVTFNSFSGIDVGCQMTVGADVSCKQGGVVPFTYVAMPPPPDPTTKFTITNAAGTTATVPENYVKILDNAAFGASFTVEEI